MSEPDYLICLECETPCYLFEWAEGVIKEAQCVCGNDDPAQFATEGDYEDLTSGTGESEAEAESEE